MTNRYLRNIHFTKGWSLPSVALVAVLLFSYHAQAISTAALQQGIPSLAPMLDRVMPAVVSIRVSKLMPTASRFSLDDRELPQELRRFLRGQPNQQLPDSRPPIARGAGSGVIIEAEKGYVVTNHHVVADAANIMVELSDGRSVEAELLGSDPSTDIALLKIAAENLVDIELADISSVQVGDYVVAIGNPFGIGQTVTSGIVSALGRAGLNSDNYEDFIQTDAAINLGNSGGALVDMEGRLIGINTAIISGNGGSNGIGFAVPSDMVASVQEHLERDGEVRRGLLGVTIVNTTPDIVSALNVGVERGAVVTRVMPGSAAEQAGVQLSDVIVEIDGHQLSGSRELRNIVGLTRLEQEVELVLYRDGERMELLVTIHGANGGGVASAGKTPLVNEFHGAKLDSLASDDSEYTDHGVRVVQINPQGKAWAGGLRQGDIIVEVNRQALRGLSEFNAIRAQAERFMALTVIREDHELLIFIS